MQLSGEHYYELVRSLYCVPAGRTIPITNSTSPCTSNINTLALVVLFHEFSFLRWHCIVFQIVEKADGFDHYCSHLLRERNIVGIGLHFCFLNDFLYKLRSTLFVHHFIIITFWRYIILFIFEQYKTSKKTKEKQKTGICIVDMRRYVIHHPWSTTGM